MSEADKILDLTLWPHRSMSRRGFLKLLLGGVALAGLPLLAIYSTSAFWVIGGFFAAVFALLYFMMQLTYRSGRTRETLELWRDRLVVTRYEPNGRTRRWEVNPYWVRLSLRDTKSVEQYLILSASGEEIELGAFLTPEERKDLAQKIREGLSQAARLA